MDDYHLTLASAARNAGIIPNPVLLVDSDSQARPQGSGYDIGFDEFIEYRLCLPLLRR